MSYNFVLQACYYAGNLQLAVELLRELQSLQLMPDGVTYYTVVDVAETANQHNLAETLLLEGQQHQVVPSHWSKKHSEKLDFHGFSVHMATAAMRIVLRDMLQQAAAVNSYNSCTAEQQHVHDIARDLHIIAGFCCTQRG
jgi:hypothetical protein